MTYMVTTNRKRRGTLRAYGPFDTCDQAHRFMLKLCKDHNLSIDEIVNEHEGVGIEGRDIDFLIFPVVEHTFYNKRAMIDVFCPPEVVNDFVHQYKIMPEILECLEEPAEDSEIELMQATSRYTAMIQDADETEKRRAWAHALDQLVTWYTG